MIKSLVGNYYHTSGVLINDILPHMSHFMTQVPPCLQNVSMRLQNKIDVVSDYDPIMYREKANLNTFESLDMYKLPQNFTYDNSGSLKYLMKFAQF